MSELSDLDALAADYVLGQLDPAERTAAAARLQREPQLKAAVEAWERSLAPLAETTAPAPPGEHVYPLIEARIAGAASAGGAPVIDLTTRLKRWRTTAGLTGALAASLAIALLVREAQRPQPGGNLVAVLQKDAVSPAFLLTVDLAASSFTVRSVAAEPQADRSYELWLVSDTFPGPRSLGVVGQGVYDTRAALSGYDPAVVTNATFAVSVEPKGGSPTGKPTGPVVYAGKLIRTAP